MTRKYSSRPKQSSPLTLHDAVKRDDKVAVMRLLNLPNIDINQCTMRFNETALFLAASAGNLELVKLLLEHGADSTITNHLGKTPLDAAIELGLRGYRETNERNAYQEVIQLLRTSTKQHTINKNNKENDVDLISEQLSRLGIHASVNAKPTVIQHSNNGMRTTSVIIEKSSSSYKEDKITEESKSWCTIS